VSAIEKAAHIWERGELDWYVEPESVTAALLKVERFVGAVFDPCCGGGNIVRAFHAAGHHAAAGSDIVLRIDPKPSWFFGPRDWLAEDVAAACDNVVMNPPFFKAKGAEAFIRKAIRWTKGKVCAFVDVKFLAGAGRAKGLFRDHAPSRVWIITPRPSCPPGAFLQAGNKAGGGTADYCWIVWDMSAPSSETRIGWLRGDA